MAVASGMGGEPNWLWTDDGSAQRTQLLGWNEDGHWLFQGERQTIQVPQERLHKWGGIAPPAGPSSAYLSDGTLLVGELQTVDELQVTLRSTVLGTISIPRSELIELIFLPTEWSEIDEPPLAFSESSAMPAPGRPQAVATSPDATQSPDASQSTIWFTHGDQQPGSLLTVTSDAVTLESSGQIRIVDRAAVLAWRTGQRPTANERERAVRVELRDGSSLVATRLTATPEQSLVIQRSNGTTWTTADYLQPWWEAAVVGVAAFPPRWQYLSDMSTLSYRHQPMLGAPSDLGRDRHLEGGQLLVNDQLYRKGLSVRSVSRITLAVEPAWGRFQALVAVADPAPQASELTVQGDQAEVAGQGGTMRFRVLTYAPEQGWTEAFASGVMSRGEAPLPISVDLRQKTRLALVADSANQGDTLDLGVWLEARLVQDYTVHP